MNAARRRLGVLVSAILCDLIPDERSYPANWERRSVADVGTVELGRQRHPDWHVGPNMKPYLRVANVFEGRIDTSDVMEMHWPGETFERFQLRPGDVLLNEGQTPDLLGRPALYRGDPPEVAFTNSLLRFKAGTRVLPEFALSCSDVICERGASSVNHVLRQTLRIYPPIGSNGLSFLFRPPENSL